jgi:hypothetical protein
MQIIDSLSISLNQLRSLLNDPSTKLVGTDARYLIGGELMGLAQKFKDLAVEIEQMPD